MYEKTIEPVAIMHTGFGEKFGIPRQSGLVPEAAGQIIFEPKYRNPDALRGIEEFTHLWIIWGFSENRVEKFTPLVTPPRLGGREKRGVFATRSPFRPNGMGLSSVRLDKVEYKSSKGPIIHVSGVDMLDGTPIYDIKPYLHMQTHILRHQMALPQSTDGIRCMLSGAMRHLKAVWMKIPALLWSIFWHRIQELHTTRPRIISMA